MTLSGDLTTVVAEMRAEGMSYEDSLLAFRAAYLRAALRFNMNNQCATAKYLGVHRNTLARELRICGIDPKSLAGKRYTPRGARTSAGNNAGHFQ